MGKYFKQAILPLLLVAVFSFIVGFALSEINRRIKEPELSHAEILNISLSSIIGDKIRSKAPITYKNESIQNVTLHKAYISNIGKVHITKPMSIIFEFLNKNIEIIDVDIDYKPKDIVRSITERSTSETGDRKYIKSYEIAFMNRGDEVAFEFFTKGAKSSELAVKLNTSNIKWTKRERKEQEKEMSVWTLIWQVVFAALGGLIIGFLYGKTKAQGEIIKVLRNVGGRMEQVRKRES